jgi:glycosyltransferase involved in cell wall biosynthesis
MLGSFLFREKKYCPKTVVICSNYMWTVFNFRLPLIKTLKEHGYRVFVLSQFDGYEKEISAHVDGVMPLFISRKGLNPIFELFTFLNILVCLFKVRPSIFLPFTIKPVIYGAFSCRLMEVPCIPTITGLGTAFLEKRWLKELVTILYRLSFRRVKNIFFQNEEDKNLFVKSGIVRTESAFVVGGSGVDLKHFLPSRPFSSRVKVFLFVGRVISDKGVREFVDAARIIRSEISNAKFRILGPLQVENRSAIPKKEMDAWIKSEIIEYLGEFEDVRPAIRNADCIILPSYREGLSRVILEAGAMGRPVITSDVPGCRNIVSHGINGYLCLPKNSRDLALQIKTFLALDDEEQKNMGLQAREIVCRDYSSTVVCGHYLKKIDENLLQSVK